MLDSVDQTPADVAAWLETAEPGDRFVYGVMTVSGHHPGELVTGAKTMAEAMRLYRAGLVLLFQCRQPGGDVAYVMQRATPDPKLKRGPGRPRHDAAKVPNPLTWEQCHERGMTANQAALHRGVTVSAACMWAKANDNRFAPDPKRRGGKR